MSPKHDQHWAAVVAEDAIAAEGERADPEMHGAQAEADLVTVAERQAPVWFQRLAAELDAIADNVNRAIGRPTLMSRRSLTGTVSLHAISGAYLSAVVDRSVEARPGVVIRREDGHRRRVVEHHDFATEGDRLVLMIEGLDHGPEAAARALAEPWIKNVLTTLRRAR